jgi:ATP-dependent DNA helicase RecG
VGVDVANATVMVILGARRFGLSQLHQLRGRVGRGAQESFCFLPLADEDEGALERLRVFAGTNDGFALAEADLLARGTGQLFGERQSGLGDLHVASLLRDRALLEEARAEAQKVLEAGDVMATGGSISWLLDAAEDRFGRKIRWLERA